tara:strand:+ start:28 stop:270 length:243 start_codon:yes stop_codon:yes gene_type:complete
MSTTPVGQGTNPTPEQVAAALHEARAALKKKKNPNAHMPGGRKKRRRKSRRKSRKTKRKSRKGKKKRKTRRKKRSRRRRR